MQNRSITIKHIPILILLWLCSCKEKHVDQVQVKLEGYRSIVVQQHGSATGAWGYVILQNDKIIIQQFTIPALEGNKPFASRESAEITGKLVVDKLNHSKNPGISKRELDSLGIIPLHDVTNK